MTLRELTQALAAGRDVCWKTDDYHVFWDELPSGPAIVIRYIRNGFGGAMADSEIADCYVKETAQ